MNYDALNLRNVEYFSGKIREAATQGASLAEGLIRLDFLKLLAAELAAGPFEDASEDLANVRQKFGRFAFLREFVGYPRLSQLQSDTRELVRSASVSFPQLALWNPIETVIQRYEHDGLLTAHKDLNRHPYLIASFTVTGRCLFEVLETRQGPVIRTLYSEPGDLVLLRAPGLASDLSVDERPFHKVSGALDRNVPRISATFRDNLSPEKPIRGFRYLNREEGA